MRTATSVKQSELLNEVFSGDQQHEYGVGIEHLGDCFQLHHQGLT
jgi:hypothetical protein